MQWTGVMPAMTTAFHPDLSIDHDFMTQHADWMLEQRMQRTGDAGLAWRRRNAQ